MQNAQSASSHAKVQSMKEEVFKKKKNVANLFLMFAMNPKILLYYILGVQPKVLINSNIEQCPAWQGRQDTSVKS